MTDTSRSGDLVEQEAIAWANKVRKASGTSYTAASRNAAAFILQTADRLETLEAENERLQKAVAIASLWTAEPGMTLAEIRAALGEKQ